LTQPGFVNDWAAMNLSPLCGLWFFQGYGEDLMGAGLSRTCFPLVRQWFLMRQMGWV